MEDSAMIVAQRATGSAMAGRDCGLLPRRVVLFRRLVPCPMWGILPIASRAIGLHDAEIEQFQGEDAEVERRNRPDQVHDEDIFLRSDTLRRWQ